MKVATGLGGLRERALITFWAPCFVHSGQWKPTDA